MGKNDHFTIGMLEQKIGGHRITIILDKDNVRKLRIRQAKMLVGSKCPITLKIIMKFFYKYLEITLPSVRFLF